MIYYFSYAQYMLYIFLIIPAYFYLIKKYFYPVVCLLQISEHVHLHHWRFVANHG